MSRYKDPFKNNKKARAGYDIFEGLLKITAWLFGLVLASIMEIIKWAYNNYKKRNK